MESEFHYRRHKSQPLESYQDHRLSSTNSQINSVTFVLILPSHTNPGALTMLSNSDFYITGFGILHFTVVSIYIMQCPSTWTSLQTLLVTHSVSKILLLIWRYIKYVVESASMNIAFFFYFISFGFLSLFYIIIVLSSVDHNEVNTYFPPIWPPILLCCFYLLLLLLLPVAISESFLILNFWRRIFF
jgi:hypothetical protein